MSHQIDFNTIRANLVRSLENNELFGDYDAHGRGMGVLLDLLARNGEYIGLYAAFAKAETDPSAARLESSLSTHAYLRGIVPRKAVAGIATVDAIIDTTIATTGIQTYSAVTGNNTVITDVAITDRITPTKPKVKLIVAAGTPGKSVIYHTTSENVPRYVIIGNDIDIATLRVVISDSYGDLVNSRELTTPFSGDYSVPEVMIMSVKNGYELIIANSVPTDKYLHCSYVRVQDNAYFNTSEINWPSEWGLTPATGQNIRSTTSMIGIDIETLRNEIINAQPINSPLITATQIKNAITARFPFISVLSVDTDITRTEDGFMSIAIYAIFKNGQRLDHATIRTIQSAVEPRMINGMHLTVRHPIVALVGIEVNRNDNGNIVPVSTLKRLQQKLTYVSVSEIITDNADIASSINGGIRCNIKSISIMLPGYYTEIELPFLNSFVTSINVDDVDVQITQTSKLQFADGKRQQDRKITIIGNWSYLPPIDSIMYNISVA